MDDAKEMLEGLFDMIKDKSNKAVTELNVYQQMAILEEVYFAENPYKVGDFVTPKIDSDIRGQGFPHKVIQVFPLTFSTEGFTQGRPACAMDMLVACVMDREAKCYFAYSADYDPYISKERETLY
jgi:hypothetical protein